MLRHSDNVGILRLVFATLVIVGHAPELLDGNRSREPLTVVFHTLSLGELAVDAFFLLSGYLITGSWLRTKSVRRYLERRVRRILPAFVLAYLLCCFVLAPAVGGRLGGSMPETLLRLAVLQMPPAYPGQLEGIAYPVLNGSMWTIAYEFRCYLLIMVLGCCGLLRRPHLILALTAAALCGLVLTTTYTGSTLLNRVGSPTWLEFTVGLPAVTIRLTAVFLVGSCFYLFRTDILARLSGTRAAASFAIAAILMFHDKHFAEVGLVLFGGMALFWLALRARLGPIQSVNDEWDISYGVYLYGWPVAVSICYVFGGLSPAFLVMLTLPVAFGMGALSWWGLEKWTKDAGGRNAWRIRHTVSAQQVLGPRSLASERATSTR